MRIIIIIFWRMMRLVYDGIYISQQVLLQQIEVLLQVVVSQHQYHFYFYSSSSLSLCPCCCVNYFVLLILILLVLFEFKLAIVHSNSLTHNIYISNSRLIITMSIHFNSFNIYYFYYYNNNWDEGYYFNFYYYIHARSIKYK